MQAHCSWSQLSHAYSYCTVRDTEVNHDQHALHALCLADLHI